VILASAWKDCMGALWAWKWDLTVVLAHLVAAHTHMEESLPPRVLTRWNCGDGTEGLKLEASANVRPDTESFGRVIYLH
jgi:hypothetical protein